jgi:hypothetical protein
MPDCQVLHTCDVRACVRNDDLGTYIVNGSEFVRYGHLFLGTQSDNVADMIAKGRRGHRLYYTGDQHSARLHPEYLLHGDQHPAAKLTEDRVRLLRAKYTADHSRGALLRLALEFGISKPQVHSIVTRRAWRHLA